MVARSVIAPFLAIALLLPPTAAAGGWWTSIRLDRETVAVGQRVKVREQVMFPSGDAVEAAQNSREQFFVYLLRGFDHAVVLRAQREAVPGDWWALGDAAAYRIAHVRLGDTGSNLANAVASFTVPPLPLGSYSVMICDDGCDRPLADLIPTRGFTIVADPATARLAERADRLEARARGQAERLEKTQDALSSAEAAASIAQAEVTELTTRLEAADRRVRAAERSAWEHVPWLVAGLVLGMVLAYAFHRRAPVVWQPTDAELSELLASERSRVRI